MAGNFNKVILLGNLTRDPELRHTGSDAPVCNFSMAMNRAFTTQTGEKKGEVCFMNVVVWGKQAEHTAEYLKKGRSALVEGHLQNRSTVEVVAERVQFLGSPTGAGAGKPAEAEAIGGDPLDEVPFSGRGDAPGVGAFPSGPGPFRVSPLSAPRRGGEGQGWPMETPCSTTVCSRSATHKSSEIRRGPLSRGRHRPQVAEERRPAELAERRG